MQVDNVRFGFANNSSSTHSVLIGNKHGPIQSSDGDFCFGWDWFHLTTEEAKLRYLAAQLYENLPGNHCEKADVVREVMGIEVPWPDQGNGSWNGRCYTDHQSQWAFPSEYSSEQLHQPFLHALKESLLEKDVTIRGGNDNDDVGERPEWIRGKASKPHEAIPRDYHEGQVVCRQEGEWFVLFNRASGLKVRLSFNRDAASYRHATAPELVDMKITDRCNRGCGFCYQGSAPDGQDADVGTIKTLLDRLAEKEVFEVAIGGGEPTLHPFFPWMLGYSVGKGIVPNFSTGTTAWMTNPTIADAVRACCGSFAMSSLQIADLQALAEWNEKDIHSNGGCLQIPLGCYPQETVWQAISVAKGNGIAITLLGFKAHGRGTTFQPHPYRDFIRKELANRSFWRVGADTLFVSEFRKELDEAHVSAKLIADVEGAFSCYIDAVEGKMGASSYGAELHPINMDNLFERFPYHKEGVQL